MTRPIVDYCNNNEVFLMFHQTYLCINFVLNNMTTGVYGFVTSGIASCKSAVHYPCCPAHSCAYIFNVNVYEQIND